MEDIRCYQSSIKIFTFKQSQSLKLAVIHLQNQQITNPQITNCKSTKCTFAEGPQICGVAICKIYLQTDYFCLLQSSFPLTLAYSSYHALSTCYKEGGKVVSPFDLVKRILNTEMKKESSCEEDTSLADYLRVKMIQRKLSPFIVDVSK